jgi:hypothetical protein
MTEASASGGARRRGSAKLIHNVNSHGTPPGSSTMRRAVRELIDCRSKRSVYDPRGYVSVRASSFSSSTPNKHANDNDDDDKTELKIDEEMVSIIARRAADGAADSLTDHVADYGSTHDDKKSKDDVTNDESGAQSSWIADIVQQVSAVAVVGLLNMMMGIPFGASYFPVGWKASDGDGVDDSEDVEGQFPLPEKNNIGLRMFLLATIIGQLVYAYKSKFVNAVGLQMVENVPFLHALAKIVIRRQGYGIDALGTLFFLFGLSSVVVGIVFYALGKAGLGKIVVSVSILTRFDSKFESIRRSDQIRSDQIRYITVKNFNAGSLTNGICLLFFALHIFSLFWDYL